jgi:hypothetical protein
MTSRILSYFTHHIVDAKTAQMISHRKPVSNKKSASRSLTDSCIKQAFHGPLQNVNRDSALKSNIAFEKQAAYTDYDYDSHDK